MDVPTAWNTDPHAAYLEWQATEAAGADRRPFSQRSIVQHTAMFERFLRHLSQRRATLATFGPEHLESFFGDVDNRCAAGTTTRLRYTKLIDRLCRHLVDVGVRESNPAAIFWRPLRGRKTNRNRSFSIRPQTPRCRRTFSRM